jgi:dipeptidyl aminopeptidase/acylaminoacyl peptidase
LGGKEDWTYESQIGLVNTSASQNTIELPGGNLPEDPRLRYIGLGGWSHGGEAVFYSAPALGHFRFLSLNISTGEVQEPVSSGGLDLSDYSGPAKARDADVFIIKGMSFNKWPDLYAWRPGGRRLQRVTFLNPHLDSSPYCKVEEVNWPSADGKWQLQGFLLMPFTQGEHPPPLIVYAAGGPNMVGTSELDISLAEFPWPLFLQRGYAVFMPNTRGRDGFGTTFQHALRADQSLNYVPATNDLLSGVEFLIKQGRVDPQRIGLAAHSYGGGVAASALRSNSIFRAASIHEGVALFLTSADRYTAQQWRIRLMEGHGVASPFDRTTNASALQDSPGDHADEIKAPTLLEFGILANAGSQGRPFFAALQYFHVPSEFIVYPRTGHITSEPKLIADAYRRNLEWFDYWLKGIATERMQKRYGLPPIARESP